MIDSVWRERRALVWVNVPLAGRADRLRFSMLARAEKLWRRWKPEPEPAASAHDRDPS
ncbi:hypothetical protein [Sphingopyxis sp. PET50]|uniref:hypothetical protein n=1 Tax=Sphingopyxis sp. PET50 TaxID=2976533 RepID=UPI0021AF20A3|nr:hypothetical protein [Sphingopyxis sp. PET50]